MLSNTKQTSTTPDTSMLLMQEAPGEEESSVKIHVWYNPPEPLKIRLEGFTARPGTVFMAVGDGDVLIRIGNSHMDSLSIGKIGAGKTRRSVTGPKPVYHTKPKTTTKPRRKARSRK